MARAIVMPSFGMYTPEGTLVEWLRPQGARVEAGDPVASVETEKATYELEAAAGGILHRVASIGTVLPVEALVGYLLSEGEPPPTESASAEVAAPSLLEEAPPAAVTPSPAGVRASPIAKRLAAAHGIDLTLLPGSGPGGRIVEADVMAAATRVDPAAPSETGDVSFRIRGRIPLTGARGMTAKRLRRSLSEAASVTITREVRAGTLVDARHRLAVAHGTDVPFDALFIKLFAAALREHPEFNSMVDRETILLLDEVHVGFAVALPGGLIVPVVHDADSQPLGSVARTVRDLTARAQSGTLRPADVARGTASISNLGSYNVDAFTPILLPPQSAVLGIGRIAQRAVVDCGAIVPTATCVLSLTFDHRVADGAPAARLLESIAHGMADRRRLDALCE
jgi:pyruvate dehydrogenase E2 component (dihydrolipoamide acetyltransferase)